MSRRTERIVALVTPFVALATVGVGLRLGAPDAVRAAVVRSAVTSPEAAGYPLQVIAFEEDGATRTPIAGVDVDVSAAQGGHVAHWVGKTNGEGVAQVNLDLKPQASALRLEVRQGPNVLASGIAIPGPDTSHPSGTSPWMPHAQRTGAIALDVAVIGQRVEPEFPASIWIHATDARTGAPMDEVTITAATDPSLTWTRDPAPTVLGWTQLVATPVGLATSLELHAEAPGGATGNWQGGLISSPGAPAVRTRFLWDPSESPAAEITAPTARAPEYVEIDDARGRVWAASVNVPAEPGRAEVVGPRLPPGLYWWMAGSDPDATSVLGPGTTARPFFVAADLGSALAIGRRAGTCESAGGTPGPCLAQAIAPAIPRWTALDGWPTARGARATKQAKGLAIAMGAIAIAMILEAVLLVRGLARAPSARDRNARAVVGLLVVLLGFALLAAFVVRAE